MTVKPETTLPDFLSEVSVPAKNIIYSISPLKPAPLESPRDSVYEALASPTGSLPVTELVNSGSRVLIIADDITRPTPQQLLIPPLLDILEKCGVKPDAITVLIALGTHRPMTPEEIEKHFGHETVRRVKIFNHEFSDPEMVIEYGTTDDGTPITVNRRVAESDFVIGLSSIVPHAQVGWGGGAKIILPGVSGARTVEAMHLMAARMPDYPRFAGQVENKVRHLIEEVAIKAGLNFIMNAVFNADYELIKIVAGDPVKAHRAGVKCAREVFFRTIPEEADIVISNAHPADLDYWQGLKPVTLASLGVRENGIIILSGAFRDGVSQSHNELEIYGTLSRKELDHHVDSGIIKDGLFLGALYQHVLVRERARIFCVSPGLSLKQKEQLGFRHFDNIQAALEAALDIIGQEAKIGIIDQGGEVVPVSG